MPWYPTRTPHDDIAKYPHALEYQTCPGYQTGCWPPCVVMRSSVRCGLHYTALFETHGAPSLQFGLLFGLRCILGVVLGCPCAPIALHGGVTALDSCDLFPDERLSCKGGAGATPCDRPDAGDEGLLKRRRSCLFAQPPSLCGPILASATRLGRISAQCPDRLHPSQQTSPQIYESLKALVCVARVPLEGFDRSHHRGGTCGALLLPLFPSEVLPAALLLT